MTLRSNVKIIYNKAQKVLRQQRYAISAPRVSLEQIKSDLSRLPDLKGRILFVHSGLKSLGYLEKGATGFTQTLCDYVLGQGGTLAMPAFSMTGSMAETLRTTDTSFDVQKTPSMMGAISEAFRKLPDVQRSLHPTHSVCAIGPKAVWLTQNHHKDVRAFGPQSPLGKLLQDNGVYAGMGVSIRPLTFAHVVEDHMNDFPVPVYTSDSPITTCVFDVNGQLIELQSNALDSAAYTIRIDYPQAQNLRKLWSTVFSKDAGLTYAPLGAGEMWFFPEVDRCFNTMIHHARNTGLTVYTPEDSKIFKSVKEDYI